MIVAHITDAGELLAMYEEGVGVSPPDSVDSGVLVQITDKIRSAWCADASQLWVDGELVAPVPTLLPLPALTRRRLRLGLLANGITTAQVEAVIAAIPDEIDRETAQIEWADASTYERSHPLVNQIGTVLSLTPEQIDAMWEAAALL